MAMHDYDPDGAFIDDMDDYIATKQDIERKRRAEDELVRQIEREDKDEHE